MCSQIEPYQCDQFCMEKQSAICRFPNCLTDFYNINQLLRENHTIYFNFEILHSVNIKLKTGVW